jgi:2,4-dienoyl-CoA reductase-like NADH-dependent reductase (Old Yellow Enzyme family)/thioredoxin reductase
MAVPSFSKLFESGRIGQMSIRNRIVMPAMATGTCTEDGHVTQLTKDYYEERAKGGAGLIIVESSCVDLRLGRHGIRPVSIDDDKFIPRLKALSQIIQKHGAKAAIQLNHPGGAIKRTLTGFQPVGPSAIVGPGGEISRELTEREISEIVNKFAQAAKRAQQAGFDGVEVHAAHTYLGAQFLSSAWNSRKDKYGGVLENRSRFLLEVLQATRQVVGKSYPLWCRVNGEETGIRNGLTSKEAQEVAKILEKSGIDAIHVSSAIANFRSGQPYFFPHGHLAHLAAGIKDVVNVPVMAVGRISPDVGERLLKEGKADFIVLGRALRADPELPNKLASGRPDDIRPCLACNVCYEISRPGGQRLCVVNADLGREREYSIKLVRNKKKVLVVGGGPAGMEAARVASLSGHTVTLCEKDDKLGGKLLLAAVPPHKGEIEAFTKYLVNQIRKQGVFIKLNTKVTPTLVKDDKPDVVIIATGALPIIPRISGIDKRNVFTAEEVLANKVKIGGRIVVLGGGVVGCEIAEYLAESGKQVTIVEMLDSLARDITVRQGRQILLDILAAQGVVMITQAKGEEISNESLVITNKLGKRQSIEADSIVLACGYTPNIKLLGELNGEIPVIYIAGDCNKPRTICEAIDDGARIARSI